MKRRNFIKNGLLFVPFVPNILIRAASPVPFNPQIRTVVGGGSASCPDEASPDVSEDGTSEQIFGNDDVTNWYIGQLNWSDASERTICRVGFKLSRHGGDISGKALVCEIWTMSTNTLNAVVTNGTSPAVPGDNAWSDTWVYFDFSALLPVLAASTNYSFTMRWNSAPVDDGTNLVKMDYDSTAGSIAGSYASWRGDNKATWLNPGGSNDAAIKLFFYD